MGMNLVWMVNTSKKVKEKSLLPFFIQFLQHQFDSIDRRDPVSTYWQTCTSPHLAMNSRLSPHKPDLFLVRSLYPLTISGHTQFPILNSVKHERPCFPKARTAPFILPCLSSVKRCLCTHKDIHAVAIQTYRQIRIEIGSL